MCKSAVPSKCACNAWKYLIVYAGIYFAWGLNCEVSPPPQRASSGCAALLGPHWDSVPSARGVLGLMGQQAGGHTGEWGTGISDSAKGHKPLTAQSMPISISRDFYDRGEFKTGSSPAI